MKMAAVNMTTQKIKENMRNVASHYHQIRGLSKEKIASFWDCVVLTTADDDQTELYRYLIERKIANEMFPKNVPYYIYADVPGPKMGSGGSILYALTKLYQELKEDLFEKKILIVCVGGQSQRLPTGTFLGKLNLNLPLNEFEFDMFDLKMAMYLPFVTRMKPGIFVTCSDDVETYSRLNDSICNFEYEGFIALGHLSSVEIGRHHGVYVLDLKEENIKDDAMITKCHRVLQKPSLELMKKTGAILSDGSVCTDSAFFFDHNISRKLVQFMGDGKQILTEIDAYKHFLQPLGNQAEACDPSEHSMVKELFGLLNEEAIHVILLAKSKFYHLGTMVEYLDNLTLNSEHVNDFFSEMNLKSLSNSKCETNVNTGSPPTIMHSIINSDVSVLSGSVVEWSSIASGSSIGSRCIISHCSISLPSIVPANICFHTVAILVNDESVKFATLAFQIDDNIKMIANESNWKSVLKYMGVPLGKVCEVFQLDSDHLFAENEREFSLWNVKLFSLADTMGDSFKCTLNMVQTVLGQNLKKPKDLPCTSVSLAEMVKVKCVKTMMAFRDELSREIQTIN